LIGLVCRQQFLHRDAIDGHTCEVAVVQSRPIEITVTYLHAAEVEFVLLIVGLAGWSAIGVVRPLSYSPF